MPIPGTNQNKQVLPEVSQHQSQRGQEGEAKIVEAGEAVVGIGVGSDADEALGTNATKSQKNTQLLDTCKHAYTINHCVILPQELHGSFGVIVSDSKTELILDRSWTITGLEVD